MYTFWQTFDLKGLQYKQTARFKGLYKKIVSNLELKESFSGNCIDFQQII